MKKIDHNLKLLVEEGKKRGYLTYDDINKVLPAETMSQDKLDELLVLLDNAGIELLDEERPGEQDVTEEPIAGEEPFEEKPEALEPEEKPSYIDDPVRLYLTQMGEIPLLSRVE